MGLFKHKSDHLSPEMVQRIVEMRVKIEELGAQLGAFEDEESECLWESAMLSMFAAAFARSALVYPGSAEDALAVIEDVQHNIAEGLNQWLLTAAEKRIRKAGLSCF